MGDNVRLKCPKCGTYIDGNLHKSYGSAFFGGVIGACVGAFLGQDIGQSVGSLVQEGSDQLREKYDFECPNCGATYQCNEEEAKKITREIEEREKRERERKRSKKNKIYTIALILFLTGSYFLAFTTISSTIMTLITWIVTIIAGIVMAVIFKGNNWDNELLGLFYYCLSTFICWLLAKGINLFVYAEITNAAGELTSSGWKAWIFTIIGGLLIIPAFLTFFGLGYGPVQKSK